MKKTILFLLILSCFSCNMIFAKNNKKEHKPMEKIVQTAGRSQLGNFAPEFAHYNDDVLFGENWNNKDIDLKTRSIITVVALMSQGITDNSLKYHLQTAKGVASDSWFSHIAVEVDGVDTSNEWLEAVNDEEYNKLR